jgi:hypothetical protein
VGAVEGEGFVDEFAFAFVVGAVEVDLESLAEDAQGIVIGVEGAREGGDDETFGVVVFEGGFDDAFADAGLTDKETLSRASGSGPGGCRRLPAAGAEGRCRRWRRDFWQCRNRIGS